MAAAALSAMISSRLSVRGSSAVMTTRSASRPATCPIIPRLARSRNPAQPKATITRPLSPVIVRAVSNARWSALGVWAKSTMARHSCPSSIRSIRPGTSRTAAIPSAMASSGKPNATPTAAAARTLLTLNAPTSDVSMGISPAGVRRACPEPLGVARGKLRRRACPERSRRMKRVRSAPKRTSWAVTWHRPGRAGAGLRFPALSVSRRCWGFSTA